MPARPMLHPALKPSLTLTLTLVLVAVLPFSTGCDPDAVQTRQTQAVLDQALAELEEASQKVLAEVEGDPTPVSIQVGGTSFEVTPINPTYHARRVEAMLAVLPKLEDVAKSNNPLQKAIALRLAGTLQGMAALEGSRQASLQFAALHSGLTPLINLALAAENNLAAAAATPAGFEQTLDTFASGLSTPAGLKAPGTVGLAADIADAQSLTDTLTRGLQDTQEEARKQLAERDRQLAEATRLRTAGRTLPTNAKYQRFMEAEAAKAASLRAEAQAGMLNEVARIKQTQLDAANARVASLQTIRRGLESDRAALAQRSQTGQQRRADALERAKTATDRVAAAFLENTAQFEVRVLDPLTAASDQAATATASLTEAVTAAPADLKANLRLERLRRLVDELDVNAGAAVALDAHALAINALLRTAERAGSDTSPYTDTLAKLNAAIQTLNDRGTAAATEAGVLAAELAETLPTDSDEAIAVREMAAATRQLGAMLATAAP
ncbi:MAG: hypothetical protein AAGI68_08990 [Planctomycetota bacterium]